jgi:two-component system response regulator QseB
MRILVVEDDEILGDGITKGLVDDGYSVDLVENIKNAHIAIDAQKYDLIILDIGLPDGNGLDFLKEIREDGIKTSVLILTAYASVVDRIKGLDSGADDYLAKPFDLGELFARIRALRRRNAGIATPKIEVGDVSLSPSSKKVKKNGLLVDISPKEFAILQTLMEKSGKVLSKAQIEDSLYGWNMEVESNTVEVHIHGIRKKLGKDFIKTIRGVGYIIEGEEI